MIKVSFGVCICAVVLRNVGGDSRVALKDKGPSWKAPKVKEKETADTKKKQYFWEATDVTSCPTLA